MHVFISLNGTRGPLCALRGDAISRPLGREWFAELWRGACQAAGVVNLHFHDLGAEHGSELLEAGLP